MAKAPQLRNGDVLARVRNGKIAWVDGTSDDTGEDVHGAVATAEHELLLTSLLHGVDFDVRTEIDETAGTAVLRLARGGRGPELEAS